MAKLHFGTENGAESERSANNSRVGMQSKAFSAGSVSIQIDRQKEREREDKEKKRHTLQEAQEQELQLPEQQLQAQGDMVTVVGLRRKSWKSYKVVFVCVRLGGIETDEEESKRESGWESRPSLYLFQPGVLHLISIRAMPIMEEIHYC